MVGGGRPFKNWWDPRNTHYRVLWTKATPVGWCLGTPLWYDLMDFWQAREGKCSMVLSILDSLKAWRRLQWGLFFIGSLLCPKKDKSIHRRAHPFFRGWETSLPLVVQSGRKRLNLYWLDGHSDTFTSMNKTMFTWQSFLTRRLEKSLTTTHGELFHKVWPLFQR